MSTGASPQVKLPTFSGSPCNWVNFITTFRDVVHTQEYLNDAQHIRFLIQQLKGEAKKLCEGSKMIPWVTFCHSRRVSQSSCTVSTTVWSL